MPAEGPIQANQETARTSASRRIVGSGEMADLIRNHDWGSTALGPIESWSRELVAIVNLTLCTPVPALTFWGPDLLAICNDAYRRFPAANHPHALGKPARELYRKSWPAISPMLEDVFESGITFSHDRLCVPIQGIRGVEHFYLNYTFSPVFENGAVAGLFGWVNDVTSEVKTERALHETEARAQQESEALRESEARLKAIYSASLEYIGLLTPDGIVVDCNDASLRFAGNQHANIIGRHLAETSLFAGTPGAPEMVREGIAKAAAGETFRTEVTLTRPTGESIVFDFSLTPTRNQSGKVVFLVPECRDLTEVKRAEAALLKSEKLAAVGRLASSIAHEINNPLESVMNLIYLARHAGDGETSKYLELADEEIRRVSIIANQTLRFHKQASNPQAIGSADLFSTVLGIYEGRLRNANVRVETKFRTDEPVVCFQGDVRQVLNNLVSNALDAMPFGGRLLIRSRKGHNWKTGETGLVLTIADTGTGIPPEAREHIFEAFFTTKGTAGNGLGLWVCQEIVARHHGALRVRSCQGADRSGTTFTLFLPFEHPCES